MSLFVVVLDVVPYKNRSVDPILRVLCERFGATRPIFSQSGINTGKSDKISE